jgi:hypothetical protein
VLGQNDLSRLPFSRNFDLAVSGELPKAGEVFNLVFLEEILDPFGIAECDVPTSLDDLREIKREILERNSPLFGTLEVVIEFGVSQESFGRNAAPVEANAPKAVSLNYGGGKAKLRSPNGGNVSAGASADDGDVERSFWHDSSRKQWALQPIRNSRIV